MHRRKNSTNVNVKSLIAIYDDNDYGNNNNDYDIGDDK